MSNEVKLEKELDCSNASRGVWLVKVPKYIARKWEKGEKFRELI
jgi:transcription initiation factor TFIIF subunit beta